MNTMFRLKTLIGVGTRLVQISEHLAFFLEDYGGLIYHSVLVNKGHMSCNCCFYYGTAHLEVLFPKELKSGFGLQLGLALQLGLDKI